MTTVTLRRPTAERVALVSMPWVAAGMPSIQLATLAATLRREGIECETHSLFLDYAARIGVNLYRIVGNGRGFIEEWLFSSHYYREEHGRDLSSFRSHRPPIGLDSWEIEEQALDALSVATEGFLEDVAQRDGWARYDVIGFSLTISQTASSMALARLIKLRHPGTTIVFGGSACAGPMGAALLRICPYVDVVVGIEGELVLPQLVRALRSGEPPPELPGVLVRGSDGQVRGTSAGPILERRQGAVALDFDEYMGRLAALGIDDRLHVWLPFESSRGCWWGEKRQCTFCGLHEIMKFRSWAWDAVLEQLDDLYERYGINRFFAVDLIMPRDYFRTLLPELRARNRDWVIFYECKANMRRADVELMAAAGVRWVQPGIESLDDDVLGRMDKGVTVLQNLQTLKWCREKHIRVTWNIIVGIPGERPEAYVQMAEMMPLLHHLAAPSGASAFELHRFSPYFERPQDYGIVRDGAHPLYRHVFPVPDADLDDLVYRHEYRLSRSEPLSVYARPLIEAIAAWRKAADRGARLDRIATADGGAEIVDTRGPTEVRHVLTASERCLYEFLDSVKSASTLAAAFSRAHPEQARTVQPDGDATACVERWIDAGLVLRRGDKLLALALWREDVDEQLVPLPADFDAPIPYLDTPRGTSVP